MKNNLKLVAVAVISMIVTAFFVRAINGKYNDNSVYLEQIRKYRNDLGQEVAERNTIVASYKELMASKDAQIKRLQESVDRKDVSVTIIDNHTTDTISGTTTVVYTDDPCEPEYLFSRDTEWDTFDIRATVDSVYIEYAVKNSFEISHEIDKKLFGPDLINVQVVNMNPNTYTDEILSYHIPLKKNKFYLGVGIGVVAGAAIILSLQ